MIVNPSVTKPKGTPGSTRGRQANHQRCYTVAEINSAVGGDTSSFHSPSTRISRRRSSIHDSAPETLQEIHLGGESTRSKSHCEPTYARVSRRRSSIHIAPETNEESGIQEGMGGCSRGVNRRRSSIHIPPEKAEKIRLCVEGNSSFGRERLEETRARLDQEQKLLAAKRKSLIERWEKETIINLQIEENQNKLNGFRGVQRMWSKIGEKGGELMADSRQALSGLQNVRSNRGNATLVA